MTTCYLNKIKKMSIKKREELQAAFEKWWSDEGYLKFANILTESSWKFEDAKEICRTAWMNGAYEHNSQRQIETTKYPRPNGIACPKCGKEMHDRNENVLTSNPPKKEVICLECGHNDFALA